MKFEGSMLKVSLLRLTKTSHGEDEAFRSKRDEAYSKHFSGVGPAVVNKK